VHFSLKLIAYASVIENKEIVIMSMKTFFVCVWVCGFGGGDPVLWSPFQIYTFWMCHTTHQCLMCTEGL